MAGNNKMIGDEQALKEFLLDMIVWSLLPTGLEDLICLTY